MKVFVRQDAEDDLGRIYSWISKDNPSAAADMVARIRDRLAFSSSTVLHIWDAQGLSQEPVNCIEYPYIIVYQVDEERTEIAIVAIFHGAQDR